MKTTRVRHTWLGPETKAAYRTRYARTREYEVVYPVDGRGLVNKVRQIFGRFFVTGEAK